MDLMNAPRIQKRTGEGLPKLYWVFLGSREQTFTAIDILAHIVEEFRLLSYLFAPELLGLSRIVNEPQRFQNRSPEGP